MSARHLIDVDSVVSAGEDVVASALADEVVILNLNSGVYHGLESVGARVWELIERQPIPVGAVRDALVDEYDVEPAHCEQDLLAFLEELKSNGLLELRSHAAA
jgi:hypothetical protein